MTLSVLLLDNLHPVAGELFEQAGFEVEHCSSPLAGPELISRLHRSNAVVVRSGTHLDQATLKQAPSLKIIGRAGVGLDNIDVPAATAAGIAVINAPAGNTNAVAEHTLALLLSLFRHIPQGDQGIRSGKWPKKECQGQEVRGKILGVIGAGRVGRQVMHLAQAFGMSCLAYDPFLDSKSANEKNWKLVSLQEIQKQADIISLHLPSTKENFQLINKSFIKEMKTGSYLINTARGDLIDEHALAESLAQNHLAGAALDVFFEEPLKESPLKSLDNCILTPHLGASTFEAQEAVARDIASQVIDFLNKLKSPQI